MGLKSISAHTIKSRKRKANKIQSKNQEIIIKKRAEINET